MTKNLKNFIKYFESKQVLSGWMADSSHISFAWVCGARPRLLPPA